MLSMLEDYEAFKGVRTPSDPGLRRPARVGRNSSDVELLAVTKATRPCRRVRRALRPARVGENRVQEGVEKRSRTAAAVAWELIGHLQSNKARIAAGHFDRSRAWTA